MTPLKFLLDKIDKLRIWGVKGAFNYLARICTPDRNRRFLIENAKRIRQAIQGIKKVLHDK